MKSNSCLALGTVVILAIGAWQTRPARAQRGMDLPVCQHLALQAGSYLRQIASSDATPASLKRAIREAPEARRAGRLWSDATLFSLIDFIARERRRAPEAILVSVVQRCADVIPDGLGRSARFQERYCGAIHDKAFMVARDRRAGVTLERALASARTVTRPNFLQDMLALVEAAYQGAPQPAGDFALTMLQRCLREDDVIMPAAAASAPSGPETRPVPSMMTSAVIPTFDDGLAERAAIEAWLAGLSGNFQDGAVFWSGQA